MDVCFHEVVIVHLQKKYTVFRYIIYVGFSELIYLFHITLCSSLLLSHPFCLSWSVKFLKIHWLCVICRVLLINCSIHCSAFIVIFQDEVQLDCFSWRRTRIINFSTNQKGYDTFETTVGKLSVRRIQIFPEYFCLGNILKVILNNFQNNA